MRLPLVAVALRAQGAPAQSVAAWLADAVRSSPIVTLGLATIQVGCKQGGAASPLLWNILLVGPVSRLHAGSWTRSAMGSGGGVELLIWADNVVLLGASLAELQRRVDEVQLAFAEVGLGFSDSSLECLQNPIVSADAMEGLALRRPGPGSSAVASLRVLGVALNAEGSNDLMMAHREREA